MRIERIRTRAHELQGLEVMRLAAAETRSLIHKPFNEAWAEAMMLRISNPDEGHLAGWLALSGEDEVCGVLFGYTTRSITSGRVMAFDDGFYVLPAYRGSSAACRLMQAYEDWAGAERDAEQIAVCVSSGIRPEQAGRFLNKLGYDAQGVVYARMTEEE